MGFLEVESGLGEIARRLARALSAAEPPVAMIPYRGTHARREHPFDLRAPQGALYDINLICLSAADLVRFAAEEGPAFFEGRYSIGVWFWETSVLRAEDRAATRFLDELWVASDYVRRAVASVVDIPVHVVPLPVEPPTGPFRTRAELGLPDRFTFLLVFDYWSWERKNPAAVVEAFTRAFEPGEGPTLVLKSVHGRDWKPRQFAHVEALAAGRDDIVIRDGYVSSHERDSYIAACDCYVSLHRSEGLGLTMAEAIACGKPVVATGYSGNLEFMSAANSHLVPFRLVEVPQTWWAYEVGAEWAEPDVDAAAVLLRRVWKHPEEAQATGANARTDILERFSLDRTANVVEHRLAAARARGAVDARASSHDARRPILEASGALAAKGMADGLSGHRRERVTRLPRRLLRRALWPYLEDQRRFELAVLDALTRMHRSVDELARRVSLLEPTSSDEGRET